MSLDLSPYLVCSQPNIWIIDDFLSEGLLNTVDKKFAEGTEELFPKPTDTLLAPRVIQSVRLTLDQHSKELFDVIRSITGIDEVEPCITLLVHDIYGPSQEPHIDHIGLNSLTKWHGYRQPDFLDLDKHSIVDCDDLQIVPTFSLVVYFNTVGGLRFTNADMPEPLVASKRGRIIMFENYIDSDRPTHNDLAQHYGIYFDTPKRIMTAGVLSNTTPTPTHEGKQIPGLIYAVAWVDGDPDLIRPPPQPSQDLILTLHLSVVGDTWRVTVVSMTGEEKCVVEGDIKSNSMTIGELRWKIERRVGSRYRYELDEYSERRSRGDIFISKGGALGAAGRKGAKGGKDSEVVSKGKYFNGKQGKDDKCGKYGNTIPSTWFNVVLAFNDGSLLTADDDHKQLATLFEGFQPCPKEPFGTDGIRVPADVQPDASATSSCSPDDRIADLERENIELKLQLECQKNEILMLKASFAELESRTP